MERARAVKTIEELMIQFERGIVEAECGDENAIEALDDSVEALESLRQGIKDIRVAMLYEDTGLTPEQIMELKERDMPKKIEINAGIPTCPVCGRRIVKCYDFCPDCGQKLEQ